MVANALSTLCAERDLIYHQPVGPQCHTVQMRKWKSTELTSFAPDYSVVELMNKESLVFFGPEKAEKET